MTWHEPSRCQILPVIFQITLSLPISHSPSFSLFLILIVIFIAAVQILPVIFQITLPFLPLPISHSPSFFLFVTFSPIDCNDFHFISWYFQSSSRYSFSLPPPPLLSCVIVVATVCEQPSTTALISIKANRFRESFSAMQDARGLCARASSRSL